MLTYQCDNGLSLTGPNTITCTNDGAWSTEPEAIMCMIKGEVLIICSPCNTQALQSAHYLPVQLLLSVWSSLSL